MGEYAEATKEKKMETFEKLEGKEDRDLLHVLDRGIDDMEAGRELPLEDAFHKINELRAIRRNARV